MTDVKLNLRGLRGENMGDMARRLGEIEGETVASDATDAEVFTALVTAAGAAASEVASDALDEVLAAVELAGDIEFFATKAAADAAVSGLPSGQNVQIWEDETQAGARAAYQKVGSSLVQRANLGYGGVVYLPDQTTLPGSLIYGDQGRDLVNLSGSQGKFNTWVGMFSGLGTGPTNQWGNVGVGYGACNFFEESSDPEAGAAMFGNTFVGYLCGAVLHGAYDNTGVGALALQNFRTGNDNCAFGIKSMQDFREGSDNSAFGYGTLQWLNSDTAAGESGRNTAVGAKAGGFLSNGTTKLTRANDCIYIGAGAYAGPTDNTQNEIVIGVDAVSDGENTTVIGNNSTLTTKIRGATTVTGSFRMAKTVFPQLVFERTAVGSWSLGNASGAGTGNNFTFALNEAAFLELDTGGAIQPAADDTKTLGASGRRFNHTYSTNFTGTAFIGSTVYASTGLSVGDATPNAMVQFSGDRTSSPTTNVYGQLELTGVGANEVQRFALCMMTGGSPYGVMQAVQNSSAFLNIAMNPLGGNVGVRQATPTSRLHVGGSLALGTTSTSADLTLTDAHHTVLVDASGAARTITLPAASTCSGRVYAVKKTDSSGNAVTIDGNASETIDGATTLALPTQWQSRTIQSNGTAWFVIAAFG